MRIPHILKSSFWEPLNVVGMVAAALVFVASGSVAFLFGAVFGETAYLIFGTDSDWYRGRYAHRQQLDVDERREGLKDRLLPELTPSDRERYEHLRMSRDAMDRTLDDKAKVDLAEVMQKLDYLLDKFLLFASKRLEYRKYLLALQNPEQFIRDQNEIERRRKLQPTGKTQWKPALAQVDQIVPQVRQKLESRIAQVRSEMDAEQEPANKDILRKNLEILERRKERIEQIGKIIVNLDRQLELTEDTFGLINDEIRARSPRQILDDVSEVVTQAQVTAAIIEATQPYDDTIERLHQTTT